MILLLVRHAQAGERDPAEWPDDRSRPITARGRKIQARVARALGEMGLTPDAIVTSPWTRAAETADVLARELDLTAPPIVSEALAAEPDPARLDADIGERGEHGVEAAVGHSPWVEEWAGILLTGTPDGLPIDFPKSGVLVLALDRVAPRAATLRAFLRPKLL